MTGLATKNCARRQANRPQEKDFGRYYDRYWGKGGFAPPGKLRDDFREILEEEIGRVGGPVLDYGCGDGQAILGLAAEKGWDYLGVDVSKTALRRARRFSRQFKNLRRCRFLEIGQLHAIPRKSLGLVLCLEVLEHLMDPEAILRLLRPLLCPGGSIVVSVPNIAFWRHRLDVLILGRFNPNGDHLSLEQPWRDPHLRFFTPETLSGLMAKAGFCNVRIRGFEGGIFKVLPFFGRKLGREYSSRAYRLLAKHFPAWFAGRIVAIAERGQTLNARRSERARFPSKGSSPKSRNADWSKP